MDYLRKRFDTANTAEKDPDEPPSTPRKERSKALAASPRTTESQMHTPEANSLEEVKQSETTQYVAALRFYDSKQTAKAAAQEVCRMFNGNTILKKSIVVLALPILKNGKDTGLASVTIDVGAADTVALSALERVIVLAEVSMRYTTDFIGLPDDSDFPLLMATISEYFEQHEIEKRRIDKQAQPLIYDFRYLPNADMYHRDVIYLRDAGASGGKTMSIFAVSVNEGTAVDVIKASKIPQQEDFLYVTEDGEIAMSDSLAVKVTKGMIKEIKERKVVPSGKINGANKPAEDGMPTWRSQTTEVLRENVSIFIESDFARPDFKSEVSGTVGMSLVYHLFGRAVVECFGTSRGFNGADISHP